MSIPRLPFLYPHLFSPGRYYIDALPAVRRLARKPGPSHRQAFHTAGRRRQEAYAQRYGTAMEPLPPLPSLPLDGGGRLQAREERRTEPKAPPSKRDEARQHGREKAEAAVTAPPNEGAVDEQRLSKVDGGTPIVVNKTGAAETRLKDPVGGLLSVPAPGRALEEVLHTEEPGSLEAEGQTPPDLQTPPYVHQFDTYALVNDIEKGGFTRDQSITMMKAIRNLLGDNLELAKCGLVSKSDVENETYLFRAACSELHTEIQNLRKSSSEKMRTERAHLQHEVDILTQKVAQETLNLKDELKGMFDDRKMAVRVEQLNMESAIQRLNYKIQVTLGSDCKGEVEGLRWFLTRRAALFIASMAVLILGSLRYSTHMSHVQQMERQKMAEERKRAAAQGSVRAAGYTTPSRSASTQTGESTDAVLSGMDAGTSPSYVSLG